MNIKFFVIISFIIFLTACASDETVINDGSVVIEWNAIGATECQSEDFDTEGATEGSVRVYPASYKEEYTIVCAGPGGKTKIVQTVETPEPTIAVSTRKPTTKEEKKEKKSSWLACMGLGGGICITDKFVGFDEEIWNAPVGTSSYGRRDDGSQVTYQPKGEHFSCPAYFASRYERDQVRDYERDRRVPRADRYSSRRLSANCREFMRTETTPDGEIQVDLYTVGLLPNGTFEHLRQRREPDVRYTIARDWYR